jgi:hypothetical protein
MPGRAPLSSGPDPNDLLVVDSEPGDHPGVVDLRDLSWWSIDPSTVSASALKKPQVITSVLTNHQGLKETSSMQPA